IFSVVTETILPIRSKGANQAPYVIGYDAFHNRKRFRQYARQEGRVLAILCAYENDNSPITYFNEPLSLPARCVAHSIRSRLLCAFADSASNQSATGRVLPEFYDSGRVQRTELTQHRFRKYRARLVCAFFEY